MAGDWIKVRLDLFDDPAVYQIAEETELTEDTVVGKLTRLWAWADRHTEDGFVAGRSGAWVDRFVSRDGFANAMSRAGWLTFSDDGMTFPNFDKHNGEAAKKRAQNTERQRVIRKKKVSRKCRASVAQKARPEKRREEKRRVNTESVSTHSQRAPELEIPEAEIPAVGNSPDVEKKIIIPEPKNIPEPLFSALFDDLIDRWNSLPDGIVGTRVRNRRSDDLVAAWNKAIRAPGLCEVLREPDPLFEAIQRARFCHGQGWFGFAFLLTKNDGQKEFKAAKLLNGGYDHEQPKSRGPESGRFADRPRQPSGGRPKF